jgi:FHS family glucose/mannose:H+ symporter-like MFS transporter
VGARSRRAAPRERIARHGRGAAAPRVAPLSLPLVGSSATDLDPIDTVPDEAVPATRRLAAIGWASFVLLGWAGLLIPSLFRSVKSDFDLTDSAIGTFYLVNAIFYAVGSFGGGFVTERIGRRPVLSTAAILLGVGLALEATAPTWATFLVAGVPAGLGAGIVDGGMNGLILDLFRRRPGGALNLLHLGFSVGAATAPIVIGQLIGAGADWRAIILATAAAAVVIGVLLGLHHMPSGRHVRSASPDTNNRFARVSIVPLVALALAIGFYVSSEIGVSSWLVRFLDSASNDVATAALGLFWGGLAVSRLLAARVADRFPPVAFAATCSFAAGAALVGAIAVPSMPVSIALFVLSGFFFGPVYPMIMAIAGALYPNRIAAVTGTLAGSAVVGGIIYPPLMGLISDEAGIAVAMYGACLLAFACTGALAVAGAGARRLAAAAAA